MGQLTRTDGGGQTNVNYPSGPVHSPAVRAFQRTRNQNQAFGRGVTANVGIVDKRKQIDPKAPSGASAMPTDREVTAWAPGASGRRSGGFFGATADAGIVGKRVNDKSKAMPQTPAMAGASALPAQNSQKVSYYGATASARTQPVGASGDDMPTKEILKLLGISVLSVKEKEQVVVKFNDKPFGIKKYFDDNGTAWVLIDKKSNSDKEKNDFEGCLRINKVYLIDVVNNLKTSDVNDTSKGSWLDQFRSVLPW